MSWIEGWFLLILVVELLTITQWVEVRGGVCWYWWNCWPSLNELRSTNINKNHLSLQIIEWWLTIPPISTKITSHLISLSDGQQFHQYQPKSPLTSTQLRGGVCWYWWNCWPSLNELRSEVIFVNIGGIVDPHSLSWSERWLSPLTSIHWVMVNNSTNINKNYLSLQLIEWWSTIPPISNHLSPKLIEWWLLTITQWVEVRGDLWWYWWNCWPLLNELKWEVIFVDIGGIVGYHSMSPITLTHWVMVNNSTNINKNHLSS
jgi:hypothetical protein